MFENESEENERGQVGIGTLIVFIAMVLVAAIAAGVLVNTAGFLQNTAEQSGEESVEQVTNRVQVVSSYGVVGNSDDVKTVKLTVRSSAGSGDIDMEQATVNYLSDDTVSNLAYAGNAEADIAADGSDFAVVPVRNPGGALPVFTDDGDRANIVINTAALESDVASGKLEAGEEVKLEITTETGDKTVVRFTVPDSLAGKSEDDPVSL
ncbi:flagellin [Salinirubellus salinus]|uniref:Flagellin n=1 Tax=Salinirubellus salinus TaxID=1364945 RepID=A0A9E7QZN1_9EURY|nr:archaellin/type IV pilin N-terminal domain-containing protein [Salinirubellus salinus]UWM52979.1 flagellin [Salinirubellus salinus]